MGLKSRLGLDVDLAISDGIEAAIDAHDTVSALPYSKKLEFLRQRGMGGDNIKGLVEIAKSNDTGGEFVPEYSDNTLSKHIQDKLKRLSKGNNKMNQTVNKFVNTNKEAVIDTAHLALGKLVVDTAASKLPKEVGLLGPLAVAELLQLLPFKGEKLEKAKTAALTYAMYVTYQKTDIAKFVEELSGMAEEVEL